MSSFTLPEGAVVDEAAAKPFLDLMNDQTLSRDALAQKLIDLQFSSNKAAEEARSAAWDKTQLDWQKETRAAYADQPSYDAALATANRVAKEIGGADFEAALALTGLGNHKALVSFLNRIAPQVLESKPVATGMPASPPRTAAEVLFPNQGK